MREHRGKARIFDHREGLIHHVGTGGLIKAPRRTHGQGFGCGAAAVECNLRQALQQAVDNDAALETALAFVAQGRCRRRIAAACG
jgi:hypothetical protein